MNAPGDTGFIPEFSHIPERLSGLAELSYNLWWSWHPEAKILFKSLNTHAWDKSSHNPVRMLRDLPHRVLLQGREE